MKNKNPFQELQQFSVSVGENFCYCDHSVKDRFHKLAKKALRWLAKELGEQNFEVRSNKAGIACSGEITLHSDKIYIQVYQPAVKAKGLEVLFRAVESNRDYVGGRNNFVSLSEVVDNTQKFINNVVSIKGKPFQTEYMNAFLLN